MTAKWVQTDFFKEEYETKYIGMHIGSVLSGSEPGNMSNGNKHPIFGCNHPHRRGNFFFCGKFPISQKL